jgi:hypothetical protein
MLIGGEKIVNASADTLTVHQITGSVSCVRCIKEIEKCTIFVTLYYIMSFTIITCSNVGNMFC